MNDALVQRLEHFLAKEENSTLRGRPALDEEIRAAEETLGVEFHGDYKEFIQRFGGAYAGLPIHAFSNGSSLGDETVVQLTLAFRADYAGDERAAELNQSYVVSIGGVGDPILINPSGEVVVLYHDCDEREVLASSLEEMLLASFVAW